jgi:hypothetical protein
MQHLPDDERADVEFACQELTEQEKAADKGKEKQKRREILR